MAAIVSDNWAVVLPLLRNNVPSLPQFAQIPFVPIIQFPLITTIPSNCHHCISQQAAYHRLFLDNQNLRFVAEKEHLVASIAKKREDLVEMQLIPSRQQIQCKVSTCE